MESEMVCGLLQRSEIDYLSVLVTVLLQPVEQTEQLKKKYDQLASKN